MKGGDAALFTQDRITETQMVHNLKCIKTGCTVRCDSIKWHGDLYLADGRTLVLAGYNGHTDVHRDPEPEDVLCEDVWMGEDTTGVVVLGQKPGIVNPRLREQFAKWDPEALPLFKEA